MTNGEISRLKNFYHDFLLDNVMPFWMKSDLIDREYGGFISSVDREGKQYNTDKSVWFQGRCLWTFSRLCNVYGVKKEWADAAKSGAEFIKKHCIDGDGRMFFTVTREGLPLRKRRYFFSESFLVVGFAEYYMLTKNPDDLALAEKYFDFMFSMYRDPKTDPFKNYAERKFRSKESAFQRQSHGARQLGADSAQDRSRQSGAL